MSTFKNGYIMKVIIWFLAIAVISINGYLVATGIGFPKNEWWVILVWIGVAIFAKPYIALALYLAFKAFVSSLLQRVADDIDRRLPDAPEIFQCSYVVSKLSVLSDKIGSALNLKFSKSKS